MISYTISYTYDFIHKMSGAISYMKLNYEISITFHMKYKSYMISYTCNIIYDIIYI